MDMWTHLQRRCGLALAAVACLAAPVAAKDWLPAVVRLSDGTLHDGVVRIRGEHVKLMDTAAKRWVSVRTLEMKKFETIIEKQSMEEKWIFKESGLDDKIYLGQYWPVRYYGARITYHNGRTLEGHIQPATLQIKVGEDFFKYIFRRKAEGKLDQKPEDLVYIASIEFGENGAGVRANIAGTIKAPPGEALRKVVCVNRENYLSLEGKLNPKTGVFAFTDCNAGVYDIIVLTDKSLYLYLSREQDDKTRRLDSKTVGEINAWQALHRDFFHERIVVYAGGSESQAFGLVRMERRGGTTSKVAQQLRRWEVWALHMPTDQWQIEKRFFVDRAISAKAPIPLRKVFVDPALGGHVLSKETGDLKLNLAPKRTNEPLVPNAEQE
jgi:hypothetical protein